MGHSVAGEVAKSQASQGLETVRARQAHFIKWCHAKHIVDPTGPEMGWQVVLAIYVKYVMTGVNYLNKSSVRSAMCKGYALDAARLHSGVTQVQSISLIQDVRLELLSIIWKEKRTLLNSVSP